VFARSEALECEAIDVRMSVDDLTMFLLKDLSLFGVGGGVEVEAES
jgi:hypothetical protein